MTKESKPALPPLEDCFAPEETDIFEDPTKINSKEPVKEPIIEVTPRKEPIIEVTQTGELVVEGHVVVPKPPRISGDILGD